MNEDKKQELISVRHAGTLYAGSIVLISVTAEQITTNGSGSYLLYLSVVLFLFGTFGSIIFQLLTFSRRSNDLNFMFTISQVCIVSGAFGFLFLATYLLELF